MTETIKGTDLIIGEKYRVVDLTGSGHEGAGYAEKLKLMELTYKGDGWFTHDPLVYADDIETCIFLTCLFVPIK